MTQASDLHLEPSQHAWSVRYRIDGVMQEAPSLSSSLGRATVSRMKLMAHLDIAEQRRAQDGRLEYRSRQSSSYRQAPSTAFRIATLPTQFGESLVLRLLDRRATCLDLEQLAFPPALGEAWRQLLEQPYGLLMVTGPTGSGKTTTLYSSLQHLHDEGIKMVTVEDPIEYELEGVLQIAINEPIGLSFARALRSLLRHDPDIIMVGETRDASTAQMALQASLTGHRVLTTLHTADAVGAVVRMLAMGEEATVLATVLRGVLAQRLLRTICPSCRRAYRPQEKELLALGLLPQGEELSFYRGEGCAACEQTGYIGRRAIFELFLVTETLQTMIEEGASHSLLTQRAIEEGMVPLRTAGLRLVQEGVTTVEEVLQWT